MTTDRLFYNLRPTTLAAIVADLKDSYAETGDPLQYGLGDNAMAALINNVGEPDATQLVAQAAEAL